MKLSLKCVTIRQKLSNKDVLISGKGVEPWVFGFYIVVIPKIRLEKHRGTILNIALHKSSEHVT
jgi:hypothetical protein